MAVSNPITPDQVAEWRQMSQSFGDAIGRVADDLREALSRCLDEIDQKMPLAEAVEICEQLNPSQTTTKETE